jgi:hypothetical protein
MFEQEGVSESQETGRKYTNRDPGVLGSIL